LTISFRIRPGALIGLPVRVLHRRERMLGMVLDTGARLTVIQPDVAREIALDLQRVPGAELVGVAGATPLTKGTVRSISLLGRSVRDVEVVCCALHPKLGFHGILGMNFLRHFNFTVDNDAETITFALRRE